jgi:hypothetical protein
MTARAASDHEHAFPRLTAAEVDALRPRGTVRAVDAGTVLFAEGDRDFSFFVVLSGAVEIVDASRGALRTVAVHEPGEFTGDVDMVSGRAALITARVSRPGEVLALDAAALRRVVTELPELAELILTAFLTRRTLLIDGGFAGVKIIGSRFSPAAHALREFATRNAIPFTWLDLETDPDAEALLRTMGVPASATPVVIGRDARWVSNPSVVAFARYMGLEPRLDAGDVYDLIVVGAGPAGLAASVYAASEGLRTLTIDAAAAGGQAGRVPGSRTTWASRPGSRVRTWPGVRCSRRSGSGRSSRSRDASPRSGRTTGTAWSCSRTGPNSARARCWWRAGSSTRASPCPASASSRGRACTTPRPRWRRGSARATRRSSSAAATPPGRPRCTSRATPGTSTS